MAGMEKRTDYIREVLLKTDMKKSKAILEYDTLQSKIQLEGDMKGLQGYTVL